MLLRLLINVDFSPAQLATANTVLRPDELLVRQLA